MKLFKKVDKLVALSVLGSVLLAWGFLHIGGQAAFGCGLAGADPDGHAARDVPRPPDVSRRRDERRLAERFGEPYMQYCSRVKRWIPAVF